MKGLDKLERFLDSKKMKSKFGSPETPLTINNYMSGSYINVYSDCGYNIKISHSKDKLHFLRISIKDGLMDFECKKCEDIIDNLNKIL